MLKTARLRIHGKDPNGNCFTIQYNIFIKLLRVPAHYTNEHIHNSFICVTLQWRISNIEKVLYAIISSTHLLNHPDKRGNSSLWRRRRGFLKPYLTNLRTLWIQIGLPGCADWYGSSLIANFLRLVFAERCQIVYSSVCLVGNDKCYLYQSRGRVGSIPG